LVDQVALSLASAVVTFKVVDCDVAGEVGNPLYTTVVLAPGRDPLKVVVGVKKSILLIFFPLLYVLSALLGPHEG